jgi:hypothetical protein
LELSVKLLLRLDRIGEAGDAGGNEGGERGRNDSHSAFRTGKSWGQGDTADVKDQKFNNAALEFENHYIAAATATIDRTEV